MSDEQSPPRGVFQPAQRLPPIGSYRRGLDTLSVEDLHEIRLLLRGESVVDWFRLYVEDEADVRRLFALNGFEVADPVDLRRIESIRAEAAEYIRASLRIRIDDAIARDLPVTELPLIASHEGKLQRNACLLLKVMHIIHHLDARELRTQLAISDGELFALVEASVVGVFDELRRAGVPVKEFAWSRKTRNSLITKLMVKRETSAARVFDRLRFRVIVETPSDLASTLHVMLHRCIPFNYIVPGQTVNNLVTIEQMRALDDEAPGGSIEPNEFSSRTFRILNFIADLPFRVDSLIEPGSRLVDERGRVIFVLAEFQVMDAATAASNEEGESAHSRYKLRQHQRVKERLLRVPPGWSSTFERVDHGPSSSNDADSE
jgi:hypothetical protein